jgi:hypothetical protein
MTNQTPQNKPDFKSEQPNPTQHKPNNEQGSQQMKKDVQNQQGNRQKTGTNR